MNEQPDVTFDEAGDVPLSEVQDAMLTLAQVQAAKDAELLAALQSRDKDIVLADGEVTVTEPVKDLPMNRAQRRERVRQYARLLAFSERQTPIVNPTIIPKSSRRRRK